MKKTIHFVSGTCNMFVARKFLLIMRLAVFLSLFAVTTNVMGLETNFRKSKISLNTGIRYQIDGKQILLSLENDQNDYGFSFQQPFSIKGKVTDSNNHPLPGVTVMVKGTTRGTISDADGNYSISNVPGDGTLVFSFVGMTTQETPVNGKAEINVTMAEVAIGIEEVVAIGYGVQKKENLTGAVASVSSKKLVQRSALRADQALQGLIPGLTVIESSGAPGSTPTIRIRGMVFPVT